MHNINIEKTHYLAWRERLIASHEDIDDGTLADTLEGVSDLREMIAAVLRSVLDDEVMVVALKNRIEKLRERAERLTTRSRNKRTMCLDAMLECDLDRIVAEDLTASIRAGAASVYIDNEKAIPERFLVAQEPKLNRRGILKALKANEAVPGAHLNTSAPSLAIRV